MRKKVLLITAVVLLIALIIFFGFVPTFVDKSRNTVVTKNVQVPPDAWYDSLPFVADLHCDELLWKRNLLTKHDYGHVDLPRLQKANIAFQVFTIVSKTPRNQNYDSNSDKTDNITLLSIAQLRPVQTWFNLKTRALAQCRQLYRYAEKSSGEFRVIESSRQLKQLISDRKTNRKLVGGMLGLEGAHCLNNDSKNLDDFYKAGVRYIGLAHFFDNEWAGSAHGMEKYGLTDAGRQLVKKMDSLHIIIDLAHASPKAIADVFAGTSGPLLVSHTGVQGVCNNPRNLSDQQLAELAKRDALVGIGLWETAVCGTDAAATAKSVRYAVDKIGLDKVAIGSDFDGAIEAPFDITGFPLLVSALKKEGFDDTAIEKILGSNTRDFFLRNLPGN
ncbi:membrane dipeptidase [Terrimonas sp. NA20]|uniref:Membrane dipeptidase n=1 Tax=Terrimonas ginsenosidimutans TaxID=2908004 RepID=A0ABS9KZ01_9BACT|nr:membrane dipeptidase [Terrimonas ginsenosidimutans]MCG2617577.1 membrane dipeptidase [Terrimonas ginsenosidimutans]